jgi:uncharacterized protein YkvS
MKVAEINSMSDFEIKGILVSLIGKAKRSELIQFVEALKEVIEKDNENLSYNLTFEQEQELEQAIAETYNEENLISHDQALNELSRWLHK